MGKSTKDKHSEELPPVERMQAVRVERDDTIVLTLNREHSKEELENIRRTLERLFPECTRLVLAQGAKLEVLRQRDE